MKIRSVEYAGEIAEPGGSPPLPLPQVAFAGRSNVGKSSLINCLVGRDRLARVAKRPGKTRMIHFYRVNDRFLLADLPGYGYAEVPDEVQRTWAPLIEGYLTSTDELLGVVQLVDARHPPSDDDRRMFRYLAGLGLPTLFVLTKIDKLNRSERKGAQERAREEIGVGEEQLLVTSAETGEGRNELLAALDGLLAQADAGDGGGTRQSRGTVTP